MLDMKYWEKAAAFHGHLCPGLAIGVQGGGGRYRGAGLAR